MKKFKQYLPVLLPAMLVLSLAVLMLTVFFGFFLQNTMTDASYKQQLALLENNAQLWDARYRALQRNAATATRPADIPAAEEAVRKVDTTPRPDDAVPANWLSLTAEKPHGQVWTVWYDPQRLLPEMPNTLRVLTVLKETALSDVVPQAHRTAIALDTLAAGGLLVIREQSGEKLLCVWPLAVPGLLLTSQQPVLALRTAFSAVLGTMVTAAVIVFVLSALGSILLTYRPFQSLVKTNEILAASDEEARTLLTRRILWELCTGARPADDAGNLDLCANFPRSLLFAATMMMLLTDETPGGEAPQPDECARRCKELMCRISALTPAPHFLFAAPDGRRVVLLRAPLQPDEKASLSAWKEELESQSFSFTLLCTAYTVSAGQYADAFDRLRTAGHERFLRGMGQLRLLQQTTGEPVIPELVSLQEQLEKLRKPLEQGDPACSASFIALLSRYRTSYMEYQAALLQICNFLNQERLLLKNTRRHTGLPEALAIDNCRSSTQAEAMVSGYASALSDCWAQVDKSRTESYIRFVEELIEANFTDSAFGVTQIAENLDLSPTYTGKLYKTATGVSLIDRLSNKRLETAEQLLADTEIPLSDIYRMAGYGSNNYFYRVFRKRHGMTPLEYRKQKKGRNRA